MKMVKIGTIVPALILFLATTLWAQSSDNVWLLSNVNEYQQHGYNDCWGYTAPNGREYALLGVESGTSIIDITDAENPYEVNFIANTSGAYLWKDIKTYREYAYVVTENNNGLQIIDLSNLPESAELATTYTGFERSHNIYIDTTNAVIYCENSESGPPVMAYDISNPIDPQYLGGFGQECHDIFVRENIAYISEPWGGSYGFYDVTDPGNASFITRIEVPNGGIGHNCWTTEDGKFLITTEETTGKTVKCWDVQDTGDITLTDQYEPGPGTIAHNAHVKGNYAYISYYGDGLRILDLSEPADMVEIGYYDTYSGPSGGYDGAWGAFPFFESGKVLISDQEIGLVVVQFDPVAAPAVANSVSEIDYGVVPPGESADDVIVITNAGLTDLEVSSVSSSAPQFTVNSDGFSLSPGDSYEVTVTFGSDVEGEYSGEIEFTTNTALRPNVSVWVNGVVEPTTGIDNETIAQTFSVSPNYPNPFNPTTQIDYAVGTATNVSLEVYNSFGEKVATLVNGYQSAGEYSATWDGRNDRGAAVASGVYFYTFQADGFSKSQKMILMK